MGHEVSQETDERALEMAEALKRQLEERLVGRCGPSATEGRSGRSGRSARLNLGQR